MSLNASAQLLIVDDEVPQMKALCDTLQDHGYSATGFTSARQALEALQKQKFDLLLTDLLMPEMDGISLLRKALEIDGNLVAIMMTAHGTISTAVEAMQAGALDYILKPFKLSAILPVLSRALAMRQLRLENAELAKRVSQRTSELEAANKELEAFAYSVSHDLRAPLRAIGGFSHVLFKNSSHLSEKEKQLLGNVCASAEEMNKLIDGLLNLSQLGRQPLSLQQLDLTALARQVIEELPKENEGRDLEIRVAELPDCTGDRPLLKQVFVNLVANALKFTRKVPRAIIEVGFHEQKGENVYFVRDNGAGFDMQYAGKLFGAFQRLHNRNQFEGTGIGLSIVQRIIHRHGGRIWAKGEVDKGASFYFTLPSPAREQSADHIQHKNSEDKREAKHKE